ncbi:MAG: hypothetical protein V1709_08420, partial [Planctomycetota bacterium]
MKKDLVQSDLIMEYFKKHPRKEIKHPEIVDWVVTEYNAEIGQFISKEDGAFLPNVDISEDVVEYLGSETRAVAI